MADAIPVQKGTNTGAVKTSVTLTGVEARVWLIQTEENKGHFRWETNEQVSEMGIFKAILSEWAVQTDWQGIHIGKGNWKRRRGEAVLPKICLVCEGEIFGLYPIEGGCGHCHDEVRSLRNG